MIPLLRFQNHIGKNRLSISISFFYRKLQTASVELIIPVHGYAWYHIEGTLDFGQKYVTQIVVAM